MNKYNLQDFLQVTLEGCLSTFKETSYDKANQQYLCSDTETKNVFDFDLYVEKLPVDKTPASPDAIYIGEKQLYFVEFKNQRVSDIENEPMKQKFRQGTTILKELLKDFSPKDCKYFFCVVYKSDSSRYSYSKYIERNSPRFGLAEENEELGSFYDEIITRDIDFYKQSFKQLNCG